MKKIFLLTFLFAAGISFSQTAPAPEALPPAAIPGTIPPEEEFSSEKISDQTDGDLAKTDEELSPEDDPSVLPSSKDLGIPPSTDLAKSPVIKKDTNKTDTIEFPQWARDIRRGEIIAFGAFPIAVFFSKIFLDLYRSAMHDWDRRYAPWPATAPGGPGLTKDEIKLMFGIAASVSVTISVTDHLIIRHKRKKAAAAE